MSAMPPPPDRQPVYYVHQLVHGVRACKVFTFWPATESPRRVPRLTPVTPGQSRLIAPGRLARFSCNVHRGRLRDRARQVAEHSDSDRNRTARHADALRLRDGLGFQARVISARANQLFQDLTGQATITPGQYAALLTLHQKGPLTLTELASAISVDRSTLTEMVRRLVRAALIVRTGNGADRRSAVVSLSPEGQAAVLRLTPGVAKVQDVLLATLGQAERRQLMRWIKAIATDNQG